MCNASGGGPARSQSPVPALSQRAGGAGMSLTTSANYEWRTSNVPLKHYRDLEIGPRLDLAF